MSFLNNHGCHSLGNSHNFAKPKQKQPLNNNKKEQSKPHSIKRPQTPDPIVAPAHEHESLKYPKPEYILKEIEKNVNFLKEMYYASLSHQNHASQKNSAEGRLDQSHQSEAAKEGGRNLRKSFDGIGFGKKSIPDICFVPPSDFRPKKFNSKAFQDMGKLQEKGSKQKNEKSKSAQRKQKLIEKKKSTSNLNKPAAQKPQKPLSTNEKSSPNNINSLFQIFKFYKRSIDSSLSKRPSTTNLHKPSPNTHESTKNNKETPNNSTAKNTTHNKNSTMSRYCGSSIQVSVSVEEECYGSRRNSRSDSTRKRKGRSREESEKEKQVKSKGKTQKKMPEKEMNKKQLMTLQTKKKNQEKPGGQKKIISKQKGVEVSKFKKKSESLSSKAQKLQKASKQIEKKMPEPVNPIGQLTKKYQEEADHLEQIQFPQIQSSLFDRNMPILEEDSREEASSELIALTSQKDQHLENRSSFRSAAKQLFDPDNGHSENYNKENESLNMKVLSLPPEITAEEKFSSSISSIRRNRKGEQRTRFPTPSHGSEEEGKPNPESQKRNQPEEPVKRSEDSLVGCSIAKIETDFELDNYELVSFEF